jgi:hypothetical protein
MENGSITIIRLLQNPKGSFQPKPPNFGTGKGFYPEWKRDLDADRKIEGNYADRRNPVCPRCFMRTTKTGACNC